MNKTGLRLRSYSIHSAEILGVLLLLMQPLIGIAQSDRIFFDHITTRKGLSQNDVNTILQDRKGYLWVGTIGGLEGFQPRLDAEGELSLENAFASAIIPPELQDSYIETIIQDRRQTIWIGGQAGLFQAKNPKNDNERLIEKVNVPSPISETVNIRSIDTDVNNRLVLATNAGLYYQIGVNAKGMPMFELFSSISASFLGTAGADQFWATNVQGLQLFTKESWVGTNGGGINKFDPDQMVFQHYKRNFQAGSISYDKIRSIFEDSRGNIWIGTEGGGLNFNTYQHQHMSLRWRRSWKKMNDRLCLVLHSATCSPWQKLIAWSWAHGHLPRFSLRLQTGKQGSYPKSCLKR